MNELLEFLFCFAGIPLVLVGLLCLCVLFWVVRNKWKEGMEVLRAHRQGYRVKLFLGEDGRAATYVMYTAGDIERKFEANWIDKKFVVKLSIPYAGLYPSPDEYWQLMQDRVTSELKRLLRDKVEIIY